MALTLRQWIDYAHTEYNAAYGSGCYVGLQLRNAGEYLQQGYPVSAGQSLYNAGSEMYAFADECLSRYGHQLFRVIGALNWIEANWPENGEPPTVDMSAILTAMYEAKPHQPILFVSYLEAYYASVWNATFNEQALAELVKRWAIWG